MACRWSNTPAAWLAVLERCLPLMHVLMDARRRESGEAFISLTKVAIAENLGLRSTSQVVGSMLWWWRTCALGGASSKYCIPSEVTYQRMKYQYLARPDEDTRS